MSKSIHIYDRASGKCLTKGATVELAVALTASTASGVRSRLRRPALDQKGFFGCSTSSPDEIDLDQGFGRANKLYLVECNEGPLAGEVVLFGCHADIAAYFGKKVKSISSRICGGRRLPGASRWRYVSSPNQALADVPRWDPVNGLWDLAMDLADLEPSRAPIRRQAWSKKKVYLYDRPSGRHLKTYPNVDALAALAEIDSNVLRNRVGNPISHRRSFIAGTWASPETGEAEKHFTNQSCFYLIDRADEGGPLLAATVLDVATCLGCSTQTVKTALRNDSLLPGGHVCRRVTKPDASLADVTRWDSERGCWTLEGFLADLSEASEGER